MISGNKCLKKLAILLIVAVLVGFYGLISISSDRLCIAADASPTESTEQSAPPPTDTKPAAKPEPKEVDNQTCIGCHNPDILKMSKEDLADQVDVGDKPVPPRAKAPYLFGELNLSIDEKKYGDSIHKDFTCVSCHKDIPDVPHNQRLALVDCKECHEDSVESMKTSAHGKKAEISASLVSGVIQIGADGKKAGPKAPPCVGCHNVHYGQAQSTYDREFKGKVCLNCHTAYGMNTLKQHESLHESGMHMKLGCMICHNGEKPGVHNVPAAKTKTAKCEHCHTKYSALSTAKPEPTDLGTCIREFRFINSDLFSKYSYVVGAQRVYALDLIIILVVLGTFALPIFHGGMRILTRKKAAHHGSQEKIYLHPLFERIWHWFQALCIIMLIITGIMIHWPELFRGWFDWAISVHNWFGWATVIAWGLWLLYVIFSGRISHYIPKKGEIPGGMIKQAKFYGYGIFKHEPHPYAPSEDNKFNPLQKLAYLKFQLLLFPLLLISGILYMYPETFAGFIKAIGGLWVLATIHYILGALFAAFLIAHLYLATTGETIGENFKAMIFGYGTKEEHGDHK
ncbi:MAG: cytochrome b/b6 domain-containing protein [Deltaproteobacteria bacterium]|nr:cytochrome b/b6 domain-containing protein [Deltaproteobacteria bacterium]